MTGATIVGSPDRPGVRLERHLSDPPSVVWAALTEREQLRSWFPCDVEVTGGEWSVGAAITFKFPPEVIDMTLEGKVLEVDEPRLLVYSWGEETLRFELTAEDGGTLLVLVDELPAAFAARNAAGWDDCLDRLAGDEVGGVQWQVRFAGYSADFEPTLGQQQGPPEAYKGG